MEYKTINNFHLPITTGLGHLSEKPAAQPTGATKGPSFREVLQSQLSSCNVEFSKHAVDRVMQRNIPISQKNLERLNDGVEIARKKGLDDTLILIDKTAYLVSVKNAKVITTVSGEELCGNVFTNIDGTVII